MFCPLKTTSFTEFGSIPLCFTLVYGDCRLVQLPNHGAPEQPGPTPAAWVVRHDEIFQIDMLIRPVKAG